MTLTFLQCTQGPHNIQQLRIGYRVLMITYKIYIPGSISNATVNGRRAPLLAGSKTLTQTLTLPALSVDSYVVGLKPTDISENRANIKITINRHE